MEHYQMIRLSECTRCGEKSYEKLGSHGHCVNCNFSPQDEIGYYESFPNWAIHAVRAAKLKHKKSE